MISYCLWTSYFKGRLYLNKSEIDRDANSTAGKLAGSMPILKPRRCSPVDADVPCAPSQDLAEGGAPQ